MPRSRAPVVVCAAVLTLLSASGGCGDEAAATDCTTGASSNGRATVALGERCLGNIRARALRDGVWLDADLDVVVVESGVELIASIEGRAQALQILVPEVTADRMLQQGYQSWSFSGVARLPSEVALHADGAPAMPAAATGDVFDEALGVSYGSAVIGGASGPYLVVGATSSLRASTGIAATRIDEQTASLSAIYGAAREPLPEVDGQTRTEPLALLAADTPEAALAALTARIAVHLPNDSAIPKRPFRGWYSWNERFGNIDQQYIRDHIDAVSARLAPIGLSMVEIDGGWFTQIGDWKPSAAFPDGMPALAADMRAAGVVPGIWLAPFLVDTKSERAAAIPRQHLVRNANDEPLRLTLEGAPGTFYILDGSNPDAMAPVVAAIESLAKDGYQFFKLDFLFAGALPGVRTSSITGVQAFRMGLASLRAAAGANAVVNACGAPIYPTLGLADSLRTGADTAFEGVPLAVPLLAAAARSYAARAHLAPMIWPDADQAQLRSPYSAQLAALSASVAALAGPAYSLGDDLTREESSGRLPIALEAALLDLANSGTPAQANDLMSEPAYDVVHSPIIEIFQHPDRTDAEPPRTFDGFGEGGTRYRIEFNWAPPQTSTIAPL